jgi:hypothetical protein
MVIETLLLSASLFAASNTDITVECDEDNPTLCTAYLEAGDPAPFTGYLNTLSKGIQDAQSLEGWPKRLEAELQTQEKIHAAQLKAAQDLVTRSELDAKDLQLKLAAERARADKLSSDIANPPFYKTVEFGVVVGSGVTILTCFALAALAGAF